MKKICVLFVLIILPTFVVSQSLILGNGNSISRSTGLIEVNNPVLNENHIGTPFITEDLSEIKLNLLEGEQFKAHYNAVQDVMEVLGEDAKHYNLVRDLNLEVTFVTSGKKYRVFNYTNNGTLDGYFVVLNDGKNKLLKKEIIKFYDEKPATSGYDKAKPAKFNREDDEFYFKKDNDAVTEIPRNKKNFIKLLNFDSDKSTKILSYIKKNKIKLNDEKDLITLFTYLNSGNN